MEISNVNLRLEPLISANEAAQYFGFSSLTVRRMAHAGRLPSIAFPVGNTGKCTHRFRISDLKAYLNTLERHPDTMTSLDQESHANL
jgi:excisionase family DNA binding protein